MSKNQRLRSIVRKLGFGSPSQRSARWNGEHGKAGSGKSSDKDASELCTNRLTSLPAELLFCLISHLNEIECWCLALTCRTTYILLSQENKLPKITDDQQLFQLFLYLESDSPNYIACLMSLRHQSSSRPCLHKWSCPEPKTEPKLALQQIGCKTSSLMAQVSGLRCHNPESPINPAFPPAWCVSEETRRLVLRHEIMGKEYGCPMSILNAEIRSRSGSRALPPFWRTKITSKITSNGSLMLRRCTSYQTKIFDGKNPYRVPDAEQLRQSLCRHTPPGLAITLFRYMIKILYLERDAPPLFQPLWPSMNRSRYPNYPKNWLRHPRLLKCQICATDIFVKCKVGIRSPLLAGDMAVKVGNGEAEYWAEVVFDVFHDLGGLRRPMTLAQKKVVREVPGTSLSTFEAGERLREDLEIRWLGRQRNWVHKLTDNSPRNTLGKPTDYTTDGVYTKDGVPWDVCFLRTSGVEPSFAALHSDPPQTGI